MEKIWSFIKQNLDAEFENHIVVSLFFPIFCSVGAYKCVCAKFLCHTETFGTQRFIFQYKFLRPPRNWHTEIFRPHRKFLCVKSTHRNFFMYTDPKSYKSLCAPRQFLCADFCVHPETFWVRFWKFLCADRFLCAILAMYTDQVRNSRTNSWVDSTPLNWCCAALS